jgi:hypothetical protein
MINEDDQQNVNPCEGSNNTVCEENMVYDGNNNNNNGIITSKLIKMLLKYILYGEESFCFN